MAATPEEWDLEAVYDEQIHPLMAQILIICKAHKMPMLATFAFASVDETADQDEKRGFCTSILQWDGRAPESIKRAYREIRSSGHSFAAFTITTAAQPPKEK